MLSILQLNSPIEQTKPLLQLQKASLSGWTGSSALVSHGFFLTSLQALIPGLLLGPKSFHEMVLKHRQKRWWCWWWVFQSASYRSLSFEVSNLFFSEKKQFYEMKVLWFYEVNHMHFPIAKWAPQKERGTYLRMYQATGKIKGYLSQWKKKICATPTAPNRNAGKQGPKCYITGKDTSE